MPCIITLDLHNISVHHPNFLKVRKIFLFHHHISVSVFCLFVSSRKNIGQSTDLMISNLPDFCTRRRVVEISVFDQFIKFLFSDIGDPLMSDRLGCYGVKQEDMLDFSIFDHTSKCLCPETDAFVSRS